MDTSIIDIMSRAIARPIQTALRFPFPMTKRRKAKKNSKTPIVFLIPENNILSILLEIMKGAHWGEGGGVCVQRHFSGRLIVSWSGQWNCNNHSGVRLSRKNVTAISEHYLQLSMPWFSDTVSCPRTQPKCSHRQIPDFPDTRLRSLQYYVTLLIW